ncbi:class I SAM-dependent methyltransferase [Haliangium ochraceum]|uniref:Methyltransferase type 12 n=1 Tax=Haliangium ochraceum (strain DSM 14365 / JCM 11303 / SMP-2) TaxID=502025 RepID=D0LGY4_HALO1|nr:class I SAM-dependent methyltransferase [Haliangium ochraceum]ACY14706.1 Methyltransferase type 12 [Haliangium ochraceum DSM 14365]
MSRIATDDKQQVPGEFNRVARAYDLLTGLNPGYKRHLRMSAGRLELPPRARILELCCGTGLSTSAIRACYPEAEICALDFSEGMLERAKVKRALADVTFFHGDAQDPASYGVKGPFDAIFMAYGIRNVPDPDECLGNLRELLRPGGALCVHEYSVADSLRSKMLWNAVTLGIVIPSGRLLAGSGDLFRYLRRSVLAFDGVKAFEARLARAGFCDIRTRPLDGWQRGICHTFLAKSPA